MGKRTESDRTRIRPLYSKESDAAGRVFPHTMPCPAHRSPRAALNQRWGRFAPASCRNLLKRAEWDAYLPSSARFYSPVYRRNFNRWARHRQSLPAHAKSNLPAGSAVRPRAAYALPIGTRQIVAHTVCPAPHARAARLPRLQRPHHRLVYKLDSAFRHFV